MVEMGDQIDWEESQRMFVARSSIPDARLACHGGAINDSQCHEFARRMNEHLDGYSMRRITDYAQVLNTKWFVTFAKGRSTVAADHLRKCGR